MKKLITLLLLMPVICFSQKQDSVWVYTSSKDSFLINPSYGLTYLTPKQDTVTVMLLVCDTTNYATGSMLYFGEQSRAMQEGKLVWWQFGYEVIRYKQEYNGERFWNIQELVEYLGADKKRLPKNIFIWISREIN